MIAGRGGGAIGGVTSLAQMIAGRAITATRKSTSEGINRARRKARTINDSLGEEGLLISQPVGPHATTARYLLSIQRDDAGSRSLVGEDLKERPAALIDAPQAAVGSQRQA